MTDIKRDLLDVLACPKCKSTVKHKSDTICCTNDQCALVYPIRDGIPVMLIEEASSAADESD